MKLKHQEIPIDPKNPFANCKLQRERYSHILTKIVIENKDGFVLAINNEWGMGKTTFLKMWQKQLELKEFKTLYFNAWENDFDKNPLVAILTELNSLKGTDHIVEESFNEVVKYGAIIAKNAFPKIIKSLVEKHLGEGVSEILEGTTEGLMEILKDEIEKQTEKKQGLKDFKTKLQEFVEKLTSGKLIFIIDELDRCRPHYAVELLEQIKHLFSIPNIIFVLSVDKIQLGYAICGVYGSEQIDSNQYLKRFIDVEYSLPLPPTKLYVSYLIDYFEFDNYFNSRRTSDKAGLIEISSALIIQKNVNLREQEKLFIQTKLCCLFFDHESRFYPSLFFILIFIKNKYENDYEQIRSPSITTQQVCDIFSNVIPNSIDNNLKRNFIFLQALICNIHNHSLKNPKQLSENAIYRNYEPAGSIYSKIDSDNSNFKGFLVYSYNDVIQQELTMKYLLDKIELIDDIN